MFFSFYKDNNKYVYNQEKLKKNKINIFYDVCHSLDIYKMDKINKCILKDKLLP